MLQTPMALVASAVVVLSAGYLVAGDTSPAAASDGLPDWLKVSGVLFGVAGGPVFAVWYAWYMTTRVIPEKERRHDEQLKNIVGEHKEVLTTVHRTHADHVTLLNANYNASLNAMWAQKREDDKDLTAAMRDLTSAIKEGGACRYQTGRG